MDISFACGKCGQSLVMDEAGAGTSIDCPNCGDPVYVPSNSPAPPKELSQQRVAPISKPSLTYSSVRRQAAVHPAIMGSLHCLAIYVALGFIGLIAFQQDMFVAMIILYMAIPVISAQFLCAVYGICVGQVKFGLMLIGALSLATGLFYWFVLKSTPQAIDRQMQEMQKQIQRQMQQFSR